MASALERRNRTQNIQVRLRAQSSANSSSLALKFGLQVPLSLTLIGRHHRCPLHVVVVRTGRGLRGRGEGARDERAAGSLKHAGTYIRAGLATGGQLHLIHKTRKTQNQHPNQCVLHGKTGHEPGVVLKECDGELEWAYWPKALFPEGIEGTPL